MLTGLSEDLQNVSNSRKTAVINDQVRRLRVDSGTLKEKDYTFFWQGKSSEKPRQHGVGFAVRNNLLNR